MLQVYLKVMVSLMFQFLKNQKFKTGFSFTFTVEVKQRKNSSKILYSLKKFFNCKGFISISFSNKNKTVRIYKISNLKDIINLVISQFDTFPLVTSKHLNYLDFKKIILIIKSGKHLTFN